MPDRVALVTGSSGGIGRATVARLLEQGYAIVGFDRVPWPGPQHARLLPTIGDVRNRSTLQEAVTAAVDRWDRLDVVVAAAAVIAGGRPLWETPEEDLAELWDVDVRGVWNAAAAGMPAMLAGPEPAGCRFVAVASAAGTYGLFHLAAYNAAKHAVVGLVKGLAADLVATGVTAVAVSPGSTRTPMLRATAELYGLPDVDEFAAHQLLHRILEPHEVAATIAFCCSKDAAALNGSVVHADGGFAP